MTFDQLDQALVVSGGNLTLAASTLPGNLLGPFLVGYNGGLPIVVNGAVKSVGSDTITVAGSSTFLGVTRLGVSALFSLDEQGSPLFSLAFTLVGSGTPSWKFSDSFPGLPTTVLFGDGTARQQPNFLDQIAYGRAAATLTNYAHPDPQFSVPLLPGLNFAGSFAGGSYLGLFATVVPKPDTLVIHGLIVPPEAAPPAPPLQDGTYPWQLASPPPGIQLSVALGFQLSLGALSLSNTAFHVYSPTSVAWMRANPSYAPTVAVQGELAIPSAGISVTLVALTVPGAGFTALSGSFSGVTLDNLARLFDLTQGSDLQNLLPQALQNLGKISLESVSLILDNGLSAEAVLQATVTIGIPDTTWTLIEGLLSVSNPIAQFTVNTPFVAATRAYTASLMGQLTFAGAPFFLGTQVPDFQVRAQLAEASSIDVGKLLEPYFPSLSLPPLSINQMGLFVQPGQGYAFMAALAESPGWTLDLSATSLTLQNLRLSVAKSGSSPASGSFGGSLMIGSEFELDMNYTLPGDLLVRAQFPEVKLSQLVSTLANQTVSLPPGFDLDFSDSTVLIQKLQGSLVFQFATQVDNFGSFAFQVQDVGGQWGFAVGFDLNLGSPSGLQGLGIVADFEKLLSLDSFLLVVASFKAARFAFPDLAQFNNPRLPSPPPKIALPPQADGLVAGLNLYGQWSLDASDQKQALLSSLLGLDPTLGITLQLGTNPEQDARLFLSYDTTLAGQPLSCEFGAEMVGGIPMLFLEGTVTATIQDKPQNFQVELTFVEDGAFISGSMTGPTSISFYCLQLADLSVEVGIDWEGIPSFGIAAEIDFPGISSSIVLFFDSAVPSQSIIGGSVSDLTLAQVVQALTGGALDAGFAAALSQVAVVGTSPFNLPASLAPSLDGLDIAAISTAFKQAGVTIPSDSSEVLLIVNEKGQLWFLTDLSKMLHYELQLSGGNIVCTLEAQFLFAPQRTTLGAYTYGPAYYVNGGIRFFGLSASVTATISPGQGFAIDASMSPIVIGTQALFSLTAAQGSGGPQLSVSTYPQPANPVPAFRNPHFYLNAKIEVLGVSNSIYVCLTQTGLVFDLKGDLLDAVTFDLSGSFTSLSQMSLSGSLAVEIGTIDLGPLGSYTLDDGVSAQVRIAVNGASISASVSASFIFQGDTHQIASFGLDVNTGSLANIVGTLESKVGDIIKTLITSCATTTAAAVM